MLLTREQTFEDNATITYFSMKYLCISKHVPSKLEDWFYGCRLEEKMKVTPGNITLFHLIMKQLEQIKLP